MKKTDIPAFKTGDIYEKVIGRMDSAFRTAVDNSFLQPIVEKQKDHHWLLENGK
jgi:hypothetical protein